MVPRALTATLVLATLACSSLGEAERRACRDLVSAPPGDWAEALPPVLALGPDAAPYLEELLRRTPDAPGAQAGVAALGSLGHPGSRGFLEALLREEDPRADEAALALGRLPAPAATPLLAEVAASDRPIRVRTAAACALMDLGELDLALPLIEAVLLAGTPAGVELEAAHHLPEQRRWALERYMAIDAIHRFTGGETFGLDPDSSWPRLAAAVAAMKEGIRRTVKERTPGPGRSAAR